MEGPEYKATTVLVSNEYPEQNREGSLESINSFIVKD